MSGAPQIHIFFGAPNLSTSLKASKEEKFSTATPETWRKLHLSFSQDTFNLCTRKCTCPEHAAHHTLNNAVLAAHSKDHYSVNLGKRCTSADVFLTDCAYRVGSAKSFSDDTEGASELTDNGCHVCREARTENSVKHLACQHLPNDVKTIGQHSKESEDVKGHVSCINRAHLGISPLFSSTKDRDLKSLEPDDRSSQSEHICHELVNQSLERFCPQITESKTEKPLDVCSSLAVSANTEFLSIMTLSQVALLSRTRAIDQNETHDKSVKMERELDGPCREGKDVAVSLIPLDENDITANMTGRNTRQDYESSLELFDSDNLVNNCLLSQTMHVQEKADAPTSLLNSHANESNNEELWEKGTLCSPGDNISKRPRATEDTLCVANFATAEQQQSKKAKLICSPIYSLPQMEQLRISAFEKVRKRPSLLKDCCCKDKKYNILVTVMHPCHIKEIQIKARTKMSSKVPLATIVVFDQSEMQEKIMLWRSTAFWSLTVFPGDVTLITDVVIYENHWVGEKMLQSTYTSRLLNFGNFSTINQNEFSHIVDVNVLKDLLAYVSSKHTYLQALPKRQPQTLNNIQHVLLNQLKPDTLVHSTVKIVSIIVLTESTYSYKGLKQRKIILTVEQVKDQHYAFVLWGAAADYCPHLQKKRDHIWEFKYLFAKHNPVSGELELHTTPWTTFECLFEDDKRAVEFKAKFKKSVKSLIRGTSLAELLQEKCSGTIQARAHISELKFTSSSYGQLIFDHNTSLRRIFASLSLITYTGCAKCGLELQTDDNKIYKQCTSCLPSNKVKIFYSSKFPFSREGYGKDTGTCIFPRYKRDGGNSFEGVIFELHLSTKEKGIQGAALTNFPSLAYLCQWGMGYILHLGAVTEASARPSLMTVEDDGYEISVWVVSELMEKMFLNIPADWLNKTIDPSLDTTYGMIVAELCHSLITDIQAYYLLEIKSHFVLDENSYPLEKDFHLLGFHLDL